MGGDPFSFSKDVKVVVYCPILAIFVDLNSTCKKEEEVIIDRDSQHHRNSMSTSYFSSYVRHENFFLHVKSKPEYQTTRLLAPPFFIERKKKKEIFI